MSKFNVTFQIYDSIHRKMENRNGIMLLPVLLHPKSNGTIRLKSTDPFESPLIDPNYLAVKEDVDILVDGK